MSDGEIHKLIKGGLVDPTTAEAIDIGDAVTFASGQDDTVIKALANVGDVTTMPACALAGTSGNSGASIKIAALGKLRAANYDFSGYVGRPMYVHVDSAGLLQGTKPSASGDIIQLVGQVVNESTLFVKVSLEHTYTLSI